MPKCVTSIDRTLFDRLRGKRVDELSFKLGVQRPASYRETSASGARVALFASPMSSAMRPTNDRTD